MTDDKALEAVARAICCVEWNLQYYGRDVSDGPTPIGANCDCVAWKDHVGTARAAIDAYLAATRGRATISSESLKRLVVDLRSGKAVNAHCCIAADAIDALAAERDMATRLAMSGTCEEHNHLPWNKWVKRGGDRCKCCLFDSIESLTAERDKLRERVKELQQFIANYWGASDPPRNETQQRFDAEAQKIVEDSK